MKSILLAIQPKWCELIASGKKTIEVRRTAPKLETPFKVYIYMTKNGNKPIKVIENQKGVVCLETDYKMAGKVIGEFVCDKAWGIEFYDNWGKKGYRTINGTVADSFFYRNGGLTFADLDEKLQKRNGYGLHISQLKIYDNPKELGKFKKTCKHTKYNPPCYPRGCDDCKGNRCERPPQSWMYVQELEA